MKREKNINFEVRKLRAKPHISSLLLFHFPGYLEAGKLGKEKPFVMKSTSREKGFPLKQIKLNLTFKKAIEPNYWDSKIQWLRESSFSA